MIEPKTAAGHKAPRSTVEAALTARSLLVAEMPAIAGIVTTLIFVAASETLFGDLENHVLTVVLFLWLFGVMMWGSFGVMRHADAVAAKRALRHARAHLLGDHH